MSKLDVLIKSINNIVKDDNDELKKKLKNTPSVDTTIEAIEEYEKKIAKILRAQKKHYTDGINKFVAKEVTLKEVLEYVEDDLMASDEFKEDMESISKEFLEATIADICTEIMESIDKDVMFEVLSERTLTWIDEWSSELAELMKVSTEKEINAALKEVLENGEGIPKAVEKLKDLPAFNRNRARVTAITEILTANSVSLYESYCQSPAVVKKIWKHSGGKSNNPRIDHIALDGTSIELDEYFDVGGEEALYPRDTRLSPKQRVNCHCTLGNEVDKSILKLSKEEKLKLREEALAEMV